MRISAKIDYACRALLELSLHWPNKTPLQISEISRRQDISVQFLTQILITLKQLGYTESVRGKKGGYLLARSPEMIKLDQVVLDFGNVGYCVAERPIDQQGVMNEIWSEVDQVVLKAMAGITFEDIANRQKSSENIVMFDI